VTRAIQLLLSGTATAHPSSRVAAHRPKPNCTSEGGGGQFGRDGHWFGCVVTASCHGMPAHRAARSRLRTCAFDWSCHPLFGDAPPGRSLGISGYPAGVERRCHCCVSAQQPPAVQGPRAVHATPCMAPCWLKHCLGCSSPLVACSRPHGRAHSPRRPAFVAAFARLRVRHWWQLARSRPLRPIKRARSP
jgi:hypothetical protein